MRILVVGDGHSVIHEIAVARAFRELGHQVEEFHWHAYFASVNTFSRLLCRAQNKYIIGPRVRRINDDLLAMAVRFAPHLIFIYRGTHVRPATIAAIQAKVVGCKVLGYNNDNPFSPAYPVYLWRNFLAAVPLYDAVFAYRHSNIEPLRRLGGRRVELLRSWFVPWLNRPFEPAVIKRDMPIVDVVFIGHFEPDERMRLLESIVARGWKLRLYGPGYDWDPVIRQSALLASQVPVQLVWGDEYSAALCASKIALCFLSKLNQDTYTRRCFEIPATRTMLLSEYSDDLASLFREGEEAEFFRSPQEMLNKIEKYLSDESLRRVVAENGYRRVHADGHDVVSRMRYVIQIVEAL
jgi:spore maturation protein CgeB